MSPSPVDDSDLDSERSVESVPLRRGGPCPNCGAEIQRLDFLDLPRIAIKREMYDVCVIATRRLPTPWRHRTAIAYHEDPDPLSDLPAEPASPPFPTVD